MFLKARVALPLFFERALIEITPAPRAVLARRRHGDRAGLDAHRRGGSVMRSTPEIDAGTGLEKLATYPFQVATWVDAVGYPISVAVEARIDPAAGVARFRGAGRARHPERPTTSP